MAVLEEPPVSPPYNHKLFSSSPPDLNTVIALGHIRNDRAHDYSKGIYSGRMRPQSNFSMTSNLSEAATIVGNAGPYRIIAAATTGNALHRPSRSISSFGIQAGARTGTEVNLWTPAAVLTGFETTQDGPRPLPRSLTEQELRDAEFERVEDWHRAQYFERFLVPGQWIYMPDKPTIGNKIRVCLGRLPRSIRRT